MKTPVRWTRTGLAVYYALRFEFRVTCDQSSTPAALVLSSDLGLPASGGLPARLAFASAAAIAAATAIVSAATSTAAAAAATAKSPFGLRPCFIHDECAPL